MNIAQRPVRTSLSVRKQASFLVAGALAVALALPAGTALAESNVITAAGTASARLNFSVVIPKFLFLQVGTGTAFANNTGIDIIEFNMTSAIASIGNGIAQSATTGGNVSPGVVTARVVGNGFTAATNLTATTLGAMSNGTQTLSWSEIAVLAPAALTGVTPAPASTLAHPGTLSNPFSDTGNTSVSLTPVNGVINQGAQWTFQYKNATVPAAGTYGLNVANKGQVTYAIALP